MVMALLVCVATNTGCLRCFSAAAAAAATLVVVVLVVVDCVCISVSCRGVLGD